MVCKHQFYLCLDLDVDASCLETDSGAEVRFQFCIQLSVISDI
jgi:hypothetical protein